MNTTTPLAPEARAAYGVFATFTRRRYAADLLIQRLIPMQVHALLRAEHSRAWKDAARQLDDAIDVVGTAVDAPIAFGRPIRQAAVAIILDTIVAFEEAHATCLPHDDHGRYTPEPGTEYPFSVSDIGRAAAQILGPDWHAESTPWGVGAFLQYQDETFGYMLLVDTEGDPSTNGDLYLTDDSNSGSRTYLPGVSAADGLPALASLVADTVRSLRD
ncbi:hypothetical protein [Streptomyces noursei]|uniref:hypothetical protein n=1 Tax=Streptomyces noursei TaxID=1971 RepID=UPI0016797743|nr:hypothetical protein [Streptomyces noursei]MCZ1014405.1 hypothetical protein [Streptomyces noursei]GGW94772.1 hypothetical protein GCM10010341_14910 [Streptomyces noursei]